MIQKLSAILYLQLKLTIKKLPAVIIGTVVFSAAAAFLLFGFLSAEKNRGTSALSRSTIGVIYDTSDMQLNFALSYLGSMKEVTRLCRLLTVTESEGLQKLRNDELDAVVYLPDELVESIMDGRNLPAKIVLKNSGVNSSSGLVRAFVNAAASDLSTAQAGIYTLGYAARLAGLTPEEQTDINNEINKEYFQLFLNRGKLFSKKTVSSTGNLSLTQYYICSGFVLALLFSGISCCGLLTSPEPGLCRALSRSPLILGSCAFFQNLAVSLLYLLISIAAFCIYGARFSVLALFLIIFTSFSMSTLFYRICRNQTVAMLLICGSSAGMMFFAGGFLPAVFLPDILSGIGQILPAGCMFSEIQNMIQGVHSASLLLCLLYAVLFNGLAGFLDCRSTQ